MGTSKIVAKREAAKSMVTLIEGFDKSGNLKKKIDGIEEVNGPVLKKDEEQSKVNTKHSA